VVESYLSIISKVEPDLTEEYALLEQDITEYNDAVETGIKQQMKDLGSVYSSSALEFSRETFGKFSEAIAKISKTLADYRNSEESIIEAVDVIAALQSIGRPLHKIVYSEPAAKNSESTTTLASFTETEQEEQQDESYAPSDDEETAESESESESEGEGAEESEESENEESAVEDDEATEEELEFQSSFSFKISHDKFKFLLEKIEFNEDQNEEEAKGTEENDKIQVQTSTGSKQEVSSEKKEEAEEESEEEDFPFTERATLLLHLAAEEFIQNLLTSAKAAADYAKHESVDEDDLRFVLDIWSSASSRDICRSLFF